MADKGLTGPHKGLRDCQEDARVTDLLRQFDRIVAELEAWGIDLAKARPNYHGITMAEWVASHDGHVIT